MLISEIVVWIYAFAIGTILGSFSGALIHRLHYDKPGMWSGRSACPKCNHTLSWKNLIPLVSYLVQRGKCAYCQCKIPFTYFLLELVFGTVFFLFVQRFFSLSAGPEMWLSLAPMLISVWVLLILFFYDLLYLEVDLRLIIPAILLAGVWSFFREHPPLFYAIGAAIGGGFYAIQYLLSRGKWVGGGDMYFGLLLGFLLGWPLLLMCLFMAYIIGVITAIYLMWFKNFGRKSALPMGAFLMPAGLICLYNGHWWLSHYLMWSGLDTLFIL